MPDYRTSLLYDDAERLALEMAELLTREPADIPDDLYARLREHYTPPQLVELAATIALENFRARFNRAFRIEANSLYCPVAREQNATS